MNWPLFLTLGIFLGGILTILALFLFPKINLLDFPQRYNLKRERKPYPGGLVFIFGFLVFGLLLSDFNALLFPFLLLGVISFWDDKKPLPSSLRLAVQIVVSIWAFYLGAQIDYIGIPWDGTNFALQEHFALLAFLLSIFWIISIQNALNWFDALPGLSVGVSGIGFGALGVLGLIKPELFFDPGHENLTLLNFGLMGLCLGAFPFYYHRKIILGDTGSQTLGFLLAVLSIWSGAKIATTLLVLALPILDFGFVIFRRILIDRKSPLKGDLEHFPHNLKNITNPETAIKILISLSLLFGGIPLLPFFSGWVKLLLMLLLLTGAGVLIVGAFLKNKKRTR